VFTLQVIRTTRSHPHRKCTYIHTYSSGDDANALLLDSLGEIELFS
jgi:hypothetical protein